MWQNKTQRKTYILHRQCRGQCGGVHERHYTRSTTVCHEGTFIDFAQSKNHATNVSNACAARNDITLSMY